MYNDQQLFINIWMEEIGTISILLVSDTIIKLYNIALALNYNFNLISLGPLQKSGITYHNNSMTMLLTWKKK